MTGRIVCNSRQARSNLLPEPLYLSFAAENLGKSLHDDKRLQNVDHSTHICSRHSFNAARRSPIRPKLACQ
jgi:hypothetical protein